MKGSKYFKARYGLINKSIDKQILFPKKNQKNYITSNEKIIIVGTGISGLALALEFKKADLKNIIIISENNLYGGVCVNSGCMPADLVSENITDIKTVKERILTLSRIVESQFMKMGYRIVLKKVEKIVKSELYLSDGEKILFDKLFWAGGSKKKGINPQNVKNILNIDEIWSNTWLNKTICIITNDNINAISIAEMLRILGAKVSIISKSEILFSQLPSVKEYIENVKANGINIYTNAKKLSFNEKCVSGKSNNKNILINYDKIMFIEHSEANIPMINNREYSIFDIDLDTSSLVENKNIFLVGEAAGFLTAKESEIHGKLVARSVLYGHKIDISSMENIPLRLHGKVPLSMVGKFNPYSGIWKEIDFVNIGWSTIHNVKGKLWYKLSANRKKIEAIHILHRDSGYLISFAGQLLGNIKRLEKKRFSFVHPSPLEIFELLIDELIENEAEPELIKQENIRIPRDIHKRIDYEKYGFTKREIKNSYLYKNPIKYLVYNLALRIITKFDTSLVFNEDNIVIDKNDLYLNLPESFEITELPGINLQIKKQKSIITIWYNI